MERCKAICALVATGFFLAGTFPLTAQDNVEGPWGTPHGDIGARARSTQIPVLFGTGTGAQQAWGFDPLAVGSNRPGGWSSIVFDAAGNIYWRTTLGNNKLTSVAPDGTLRWNAQNAAGNGDYVFGGGWNSTGPIVGEQFVYALGAGIGNTGGDPATPDPMLRPVVAAFDKGTGALIWETFLPENFMFPVGWSDNNQPTPILYDGKLYVVGENDTFSANVYQVDAATGVIDWGGVGSNIVWLTTGARHGTLAFAPGIFAGQHGLFIHTDSGLGNDGFPEVVALQIDPNPATGGATFAWGSEGGKATRGHPIYSAFTNRVYTHTWTDYGAELYSFDALTGAVVGNQNAANSGHGFYDVGMLGFDDASVVAGGFNGNIVQYTEDGMTPGTTTDMIFPFTNDDCAPNWFGEYRVLGQLLQDKAGNWIVVAGTNSRVNADPNDPFCAARGPGPYPDLTARAVMLNISTAIDLGASEDGPLYIDDLEVLHGPNTASLTQIYFEDFDTGAPYALGDLPGQNGWQDNRVPPSGDRGPVQVVNDPTGGGHGQVIEFDALGNGGGWQGCYQDTPDATDAVKVIRWKQWRADLTDNVWISYGAAPGAFNDNWSFQWDSSQSIHPYQFSGGGAEIPLTAGQWQTVTITYDSFNFIAEADVDGVSSFPPAFPAFFEVLEGLNFEMEGTAVTTNVTRNRPMVEFDSGVDAQNGFTLRGGPLVGPDGKMYYFHGTARTLIALEPVFVKGDANCDGVLNTGDIPAFVTALVDGQTAWEAMFPCNYLGGNDLNNDSVVDGRDVATMVACLVP